MTEKEKAQVVALEGVCKHQVGHRFIIFLLSLHHYNRNNHHCHLNNQNHHNQ